MSFSISGIITFDYIPEEIDSSNNFLGNSYITKLNINKMIRKLIKFATIQLISISKQNNNQIIIDTNFTDINGRYLFNVDNNFNNKYLIRVSRLTTLKFVNRFQVQDNTNNNKIYNIESELIELDKNNIELNLNANLGWSKIENDFIDKRESTPFNIFDIMTEVYLKINKINNN